MFSEHFVNLWHCPGKQSNSGFGPGGKGDGIQEGGVGGIVLIPYMLEIVGTLIN